MFWRQAEPHGGSLHTCKREPPAARGEAKRSKTHKRRCASTASTQQQTKGWEPSRGGSRASRRQAESHTGNKHEKKEQTAQGRAPKGAGTEQRNPKKVGKQGRHERKEKGRQQQERRRDDKQAKRQEGPRKRGPQGQGTLGRTRQPALGEARRQQGSEISDRGDNKHQTKQTRGKGRASKEP